MQSTDLSREQIEKIKEQIRPMMVYLNRLQNRMGQRGFHPSDEIYQLTKAAHDAVHHLSVKLHYLSYDADKRPKAK